MAQEFAEVEGDVIRSHHPPYAEERLAAQEWDNYQHQPLRYLRLSFLLHPLLIGQAHQRRIAYY